MDSGLHVVSELSPVPLHVAKLFQQVYGTNKGSIYHCIAIAKDFNVAARITPAGALSIRVEGDLAKYNDLLTEAGAQRHDNKDGEISHYSLHVACSSVKAAIKTTGAFLFSLNTNYYLGLATDLTGIVGKGT
jgi:hypothetical protein